MLTYTNSNGITFNLYDDGPDGQFNRHIGWYNPFEGKLGEIFKVVISARTKRELKQKLENHNH